MPDAIKYDPQTDTLTLRLADRQIAHSDELQPGLMVDYDTTGGIVGVELLGVKRRIDQASPAPPGSLAALAKSAIEANIGSGKPVDTSQHTKEIMRAEFADYIRRHNSKPGPEDPAAQTHEELEALLRDRAVEAAQDTEYLQSLTDSEAFGEGDLYDETP